jgi:hypothetical protein
VRENVRHPEHSFFRREASDTARLKRAAQAHLRLPLPFDAQQNRI